MSRGDYVRSLIETTANPETVRFMSSRPDDIYSLTFAENLRSLSEMSMTRFEWLNLPDTIPEQYIERKLFHKGCVVFFRDDPATTNALLALEGAGTGNQNHYGEWTRYRITAPTYRQMRTLSSMECAPVFSNPSRTPDVLVAYLYAHKLTELDITFDINARNARRTRVVVADSNRRLTMANVSDAIDRGDPVIELTRGLDAGEIETLDMGVDPKNLIDVHIARQRLWADAMTRLGIDNANQDKKERLVSDEVESNDAQIGAMRQVGLNTRLEACKLINRRFGTDISVRYREMTVDVGTTDTRSIGSRWMGNQED